MNQETTQILINAAITMLSIAIIFILNILIKLYNRKHGKNIPTLNTNEIIERIIEAEKILGKGQGVAKLNYVLGKLGKHDKKTEKKVNEIHAILKTGKETLENKIKQDKQNKGE